MMVSEAIKMIQCRIYNTASEIVGKGEDGKAFEDLEMAIQALEKQIPMKPIYSDYDDNGNDEIIPYKAICPICENEFEFGYWNDEYNHHCVCGQSIDWDRKE